MRSVNDPPPPPSSSVITIPVPPTNLGGAGVNMNTGIIIQANQPYMVRVSGRIDVSDNPAASCQTTTKPPYGAEGSYGPGGTGGAWGSLRIAATGVGVDTGGPGGASEARSDTLAGYSYPTEVTVSRSKLIREVGGGNCPPTGFYLLNGTQTLTVTYLDGIELNVAPKAVAVKKGTKVTFTARSRGTIVGGAMWKFIKSDSFPDQTTQCGPNPCEVTAMNSGTLRATAWLYGRYRSDAAAIRVYTTFTLDADRTLVDYGDTVTFTPKLDGVLANADRWRWVPDAGTFADGVACPNAVAPCKKRMKGSGVMWAYAGLDSASAGVEVRPPKITLTASPASLAPGDSSTLTATAKGTLDVQGWAFRVDGGGGPGVSPGRRWRDCGAGISLCRTPVYASGMVFVTGTVDGYASTDSVHISVSSECPSLTKIATAVRFSVTRSSDCMPDGSPVPPQPGGDVGPETDPLNDCGSVDSLMASYFPPPVARMALMSRAEQRGGPRSVDPDGDLFCALGTCIRDATGDESAEILLAAIHSPEWRYTQGGAKGGPEPPKDIAAHYGDCTDFVWQSTKTGLGPAWPHSWAAHIATGDFHDLSPAGLVVVGYRKVPPDSAWAGDIVVRGGHAGVFKGFDDSGTDYRPGVAVWGFANNGSPAHSDGRPNRDGDTDWYNFSTTYDDKGNPVEPEFFRAVVSYQCP
jgi:hypothetical protein